MIATIRNDSLARWLGIIALVGAPALVGCEEHATVGDDEDQGELGTLGQTDQSTQTDQTAEGQLEPQTGEQAKPEQQGQYAQGLQQGQEQGYQEGQQQGFQQGQQQGQQQAQQGQQAQQDQLAQQDLQQQGVAQQGQGSQGMQGGQGMQGANAQQGMVRGTVQNVSPDQGTVALQSGGQTITLHARPDELASLSQGQSVTLPYESYGGEPWIVPGNEQQQQQQQGMGAAPSSQMHLTGTVQAVDRMAGVIAVGDMKLRVHPQQVQDVSPGQTVSVTYQNVQNVPWVEQIQPQGGSMASAQQGNEALGSQG